MAEKDTITSTSVWALVLGIGLVALMVGGAVGHWGFPATETVTNTEVKEVPGNYVLVEGIEYTADDISELLVEDEEPVETTELQENIDVRTAAVDYFLAEWKDEFEFKDANGDFGPVNETYDYDELIEEEGVDVELEDYPDTGIDNEYDLLNEVTANEVDIEDSDWEVEFTVEIEVDGTDIDYTITTTYEDGEADDLEIEQA